MFVHTVFFWLKKSISEEQRQEFCKGAKTLIDIKPSVVTYFGKPADTTRPVVDRTYDYSLTCIFENKADHDLYQCHPVHLEFIDKHANDWSRVVIYDAD